MEDKGDTRKFIKPRHNIVLPGLCNKISFWINGRNDSIVMSVIFLDENNIIDILRTNPPVMDFLWLEKSRS